MRSSSENWLSLANLIEYKRGAMVFEDTDPESREDMQIEYSFMRMVHVGVLVAAKYGAFIIQ